VLLLDDGSTDKSKEIYTELKQKYKLKTVLHEDGPLGYGYSILTLFREAKKEYDLLITFDADLQHAPFSIKEIIVEFESDPKIDLVSTSRYLSYRFWKDNTKVPVDRYVTNMYLTQTINEIFDMNITDAFCGLKGYKVKKLPTDLDDAGYAFPLIFWHFVSLKSLKIKEIETPIIYRLDRRSRGEWKVRTHNYFEKLESLFTSERKKEIIRSYYKKGIEQITEIIDHYSSFPIYTFNDFFKMKWLEHQ
jgi:glycosyltransferase involved in cell wall biosynthesis